ncbi:MAG: hypothetical protein RLZZ428_193 [Pseudomonadota bacterium]
MKVTVKKVDDANVIIKGTIENGALEESINKMAAKAGKEIKVDGFRKGKVPAHVVKKLHGDKLAHDAEGDAVQNFINEGAKQAKLNPADILGQPTFKKYEKKEEGIEVEIEISTRPTFSVEGHMDVVPSFKTPKATKKAIDEKLNEIASGQAEYKAIAKKRMVKNGDMAIIDFEGFLDGVPFDGGKAEKFSLKIGSGQFIPGFEDQVIGMKYEEEKTIKVTFPKEYQAANLAGKETEFKVKLHEIQEQTPVELNDELAAKLLRGEENATLETLTERVKNQIEATEISKLYNEDLKPKLVEALVEKFDFALPNNIVEQEIDAKVNAKAREMSEEELKSYKDNPKKVDTLREEMRADAVASVKATFIVDALAKKEEVSVSDQEVTQAIYYEAMMSGQNPQDVIKYYQENNLLPAVKMGMIEDKLFGKMLGLDK